MSKKKQITLLVIIMMIVALFTRLFPHVPNAVPLAGVAILGAAYLRRGYLPVLLIAALYYLGDLVLNNTTLRVYYPDVQGAVWYSEYMLGVGLSIVLMVIFGRYLLRKITPLRVLGGALGAGILFFLVTNFQVWSMGTMYSKDLSGLVECYIAGIPFFRSAVLTDVVFAAVSFAIVEYVSLRQPDTTVAKVVD